MRIIHIEYYLKAQHKKYKPTAKEMAIIMEDINGTREVTLNNACKIIAINKNIITFKCENSVFVDYGNDVLLHPDDDGNYYVNRTDKNGTTYKLGWYAKIYTPAKTHKKRKI